MIFNHPAMLWGLLALAIPIVVHLFNFRRYRKVYFSNVDALTELQAESRRRHALRQWLVLAARLLAIALLVLAFAQPVLPHKGQQLQSGSCAVSIYLDNTFSTQATQSDPLQSGAAKVRQLVNAYSASDQFQLLTADLRGSEMRWLSREELLQVLDEVQPSAAAPMLSQVVERQAAFLGRSAARNKHAYVVSDFQRSTSDVEYLSTDSTIQLTLLPLQAAAVSNLYVDTVLLDAPTYRVGGAVNVEAKVVNDGTSDIAQVPVRLYVDGRERAMTTLDLSAGATATARLSFSIAAAGWMQAYVEISDYPVTFDDRYYFALLSGAEVPMLEVGDPCRALHRLMQADSVVHLSSTPLTRLDMSSLTDYTILWLSAAEALPTGVVQALAEWVRQGGTLVVVPPATTLPSGYNDLLAAVGAPALGTWTTQPVRATAVDVQNPLYRGVFAAAVSDMEMPLLQGRYRMVASEGVASQSVLSLSGADMLAVAPCGKGCTYLFALPLDPHWTDFTAQALFVPTVYNMALFSRKQPVVSYPIDCSLPIQLAEAHTSGVSQLVKGQSFNMLPDLRNVGGQQQLLLHEPLPEAGVYSLDAELLAFNYPRAESRLQCYSASELSEAVPQAVLLEAQERQVDTLISQRRQGRALWRWCVVGALLALLAETLLLLPRKR